MLPLSQISPVTGLAATAYQTHSTPSAKQSAWPTTSWPFALVKVLLKSTTTSHWAPLPAWALARVLVTHWVSNCLELLPGWHTVRTTTTRCQLGSAAHAYLVAGSTNSSGARIRRSSRNLRRHTMRSEKQLDLSVCRTTQIFKHHR